MKKTMPFCWNYAPGMFFQWCWVVKKCIQESLWPRSTRSVLTHNYCSVVTACLHDDLNYFIHILLQHRHRASFTNSLRQRKPSFGVKIVLSGFTKDTQWRISAEKEVDKSYFCTWPYWIWICRSFPLRCKIYGRRVLKWITQWDLLMFALVRLLVFAPLFNTPKKHVLNYFALL